MIELKEIVQDWKTSCKRDDAKLLSCDDLEFCGVILGLDCGSFDIGGFGTAEDWFKRRLMMYKNEKPLFIVNTLLKDREIIENMMIGWKKGDN